MAKTKLTKALHRKIVSKIKEGQYKKTVMEFYGLHETTFYLWVRRAKKALDDRESDGKRIKKSDQKFVDFYLDVKAAQAHDEIRLVNRHKDLEKSDNDAVALKAVQFRLERQHQHWRPESTVNNRISGADGGPLVFEHSSGLDLSKLTPAELAEIVGDEEE